MKDVLKALREANNYSQATVAKYLNVSRQMYIKYESGEVEPSVKVVVELSKLYKVSYEEIIDNKVTDSNQLANANSTYSVYKDSLSEMCVASPVVAYGGSSYKKSDNNFELVKTIIPKLTVFEQLKILSLLAAAIGKNGANEIAASNPVQTKSSTLSQAQKDELFEKYSGCLKDSDIKDSKDARLEHIYKKARNTIQKNDVPELTLDEINAEIGEVRK